MLPVAFFRLVEDVPLGSAFGLLGESRGSIDMRMKAKREHEAGVRARAQKRSQAAVSKRQTTMGLLDRRLSEQRHRQHDIGRQAYSMMDLS